MEGVFRLGVVEGGARARGAPKGRKGRETLQNPQNNGRPHASCAFFFSPKPVTEWSMGGMEVWRVFFG